MDDFFLKDELSSVQVIDIDKEMPKCGDFWHRSISSADVRFLDVANDVKCQMTLFDQNIDVPWPPI